MTKFLSLFLVLGLSFATAAAPPVQRQAINVLRVASAVVDGETVTIGTTVFEVDTTVAAGITVGNVRVDVSGGSTAAAAQTLTFSANAANTETVTIGSTVYTFQTTLTNVAGNVKVGATAADSVTNLVAAINAGSGSGTLYAAATTAHANVTAADGVGDTVVITAKIPGAGANAIATTETGAQLAWGAATMAGGVSPTAGDFTTAFTTAVNNANLVSLRINATRISASEVLITSLVKAQDTRACTETLAGTNNVFAAAALYGGSSLNDLERKVSILSRAATATEATLETMHFAAPFTPIAATASVRTAAGVAKAWDGALVITGSRVDLNSSGSTDVASTDVVTVLVSQ